MLLAIVSCEEELPEPIAVTSVSLNAEAVEMTEGDEVILIATVSPKNADNKSLIWISSNLSIVSVDDNISVDGSLLVGGGISLCIEIIQLPFSVRATDIDDLILNTVGVIVGYGIYALIRYARRIKK